MATEATPERHEPSLGEILQELAKNSRPVSNKMGSITPMTTPSGVTSSQSLCPYPHGIEKLQIIETKTIEAGCNMYEGTRFTQEEGEKLMTSLNKAILDQLGSSSSTKAEVNLSMFAMVIKHLDFSHYFLLDKVFNALDTDEDAVISPLELISGLSTLLRGSFEEHIKFAFSVYDTQRQGFLTPDDVTKSINDSLKSTSKVSKTGTKTHENSKALSDLIFPKLDIDADGLISFNDFRSACVNDPTLIEALGSWLPKESPCHNAHRVSQEGVSNLSKELEYLTRTSIMAQLCTPKKIGMNRKKLKPIGLKE